MRYEDFREGFLNNEFELSCSFCGAVFWVEQIDGEEKLVRVGETRQDRCPICSEIHEMMS